MTINIPHNDSEGGGEVAFFTGPKILSTHFEASNLSAQLNIKRHRRNPKKTKTKTKGKGRATARML